MEPHDTWPPGASKGGAVLNGVLDEIRESYARADACLREAENASSEKARQDCLRLEQNWLSLARHIQFADRLTGFLQS
jgi:hypothetical protein